MLIAAVSSFLFQVGLAQFDTAKVEQDLKQLGQRFQISLNLRNVGSSFANLAQLAPLEIQFIYDQRLESPEFVQSLSLDPVAYTGFFLSPETIQFIAYQLWKQGSFEGVQKLIAAAGRASRIWDLVPMIDGKLSARNAAFYRFLLREILSWGIHNDHRSFLDLLYGLPSASLEAEYVNARPEIASFLRTNNTHLDVLVQILTQLLPQEGSSDEQLENARMAFRTFYKYYVLRLKMNSESSLRRPADLTQLAEKFPDLVSRMDELIAVVNAEIDLESEDPAQVNLKHNLHLSKIKPLVSRGKSKSLKTCTFAEEVSRFIYDSEVPIQRPADTVQSIVSLEPSNTESKRDFDLIEAGLWKEAILRPRFKDLYFEKH